MSEITLGIDFGSSFISILKKGEDLVLKEANLISVKKDNGNYINDKVGDSAKLMLGKTDNSITIFSPVSSGEIVSMPHATYLFKELLNKLEIKKSFFNKINMIIAVPTGISEEEKQKYVELCKSVGAKQVITIPKCLCNALGENINISANNARLIVDIGGGTIDCAVINMNTIIVGNTLCLGGRSMDSSICDYIYQKYQTKIGLKTAEQLKEQIGSLYPNDSACMQVNGLKDNIPVNVTVTAKDIYEATYLYLDEIVKVIKITIKSLTPEIASDVVRNGIVVCGGYSRIVGLEKHLRQRLNINVKISDNSENSTARGLNVIINHDDILQNILTNL